MTTTLDAVRAAALFAGDLEPSQHPGPAQVRRTVTTVLHRRGALWCTARVEAAFAADPAAASNRMTWAWQVIRDCYRHDEPAPRMRCAALPLDWSGRMPLRPPGTGPRCRFPLSRYQRRGR
jgi:hypothetical protein